MIQSGGRVGRKADGKDFGMVVDFVDDFSMYKGWARQRKNYYKKLECEVEEDEGLFSKRGKQNNWSESQGSEGLDKQGRIEGI